MPIGFASTHMAIRPDIERRMQRLALLLALLSAVAATDASAAAW